MDLHSTHCLSNIFFCPKDTHAALISAGIQVPSVDDDIGDDDIQCKLPAQGHSAKQPPSSQLLAQCIMAGSFTMMLRLKSYLKAVMIIIPL